MYSLSSSSSSSSFDLENMFQLGGTGTVLLFTGLVISLVGLMSVIVLAACLFD